MKTDYAYEIREAIKIDVKIAKKNNEKYSNNMKNELEKLILSLENTSKLEKLYKYRFAVCNAGITNRDLEDVYIKLFRKMKKTNENSVIFTEWNNIFSTIFGNMPSIYNMHGKDYINKIVDMFYITKDENKLKLLMLLFTKLYNVETKDLVYVDLILDYINKTEENYILKSYEKIIKYSLRFLENDFLLSSYKNNILEIFSKSISDYNSLVLSNVLDIFFDKDIKNERLVNIFSIIALSKDKELIDSYYNLLNSDKFVNLKDFDLQNKCFDLLSDVDNNINLIIQIILNIIISNNNDYIRQYLLEKVRHIKNPKSLELLIMLNPILLKYSDEDEYIRVVDSIEDKNNNLSKLLILKFSNNGKVD